MLDKWQLLVDCFEALRAFAFMRLVVRHVPEQSGADRLKGAFCSQLQQKADPISINSEILCLLQVSHGSIRGVFVCPSAQGIRDEGFSEYVTRQVCNLGLDLQGSHFSANEIKGGKKTSILLCLVKVHNWEFCIKNGALQRELAFDTFIPSRPNFDCQLNKERSRWLYEPKYQMAYSYKASSAPRPMTDMVWWHQDSWKIKKLLNKATYVQKLDVAPATAVCSSSCRTAERLNQLGIFNFTAPEPLFYDLAKVLYTSSLQWLTYTHVVCNKLQKTTCCRTASRQLAAMYGERFSRRAQLGFFFGAKMQNSKCRIFTAVSESGFTLSPTKPICTV